MTPEQQLESLLAGTAKVLSEKELLAALKEREQEIAEGQFFTTTELRKFLKVWRQMGKK